jgi:pyruvate/2-oxoglutarate dehydrogenase complex dihydrolipoamide dehydrogenase (E3) component
MADFDLAVIGAGAAGLSVTAVAAQLGVRVALIERGRMGGECLNTGCVPSKALLATAHAAIDAAAAPRLGLRFAPPRIDWAAVQAHVHGVIAAIAPADSQARFEALGATVLRETARFVASDTLAVGAARLTARRIVIAAGSRPSVPDVPGLAETPFLTHETLFDLPDKPAHLLILGGGPVGLEMAQAHAGLGCRVTLVTSGRIAPREDPELADVLRAELRGNGVDLRENAAVARVDAGPTLVLRDGARLSGSHLLIATGRRPNLDALDLAAGGVAATSRGIATDAGLRSITNRCVYAVGDIADPAGIGPRHFTHVASYHAAIVIRRALFRLPARLDYAALPRVIYTAPELAQVGLTEAEALATGRQVRVLRWTLQENDRAQAERRIAGLAKLVVTPRGRILGAGFAAAAAGEAIGAWTLAIARRIPLSAMAGTIVPYPTRAEAGKRAAGSFYAPRLFAALPRRIVRLLARLP